MRVHAARVCCAGVGMPACKGRASCLASRGVAPPPDATHWRGTPARVPSVGPCGKDFVDGHIVNGRFPQGLLVTVRATVALEARLGRHTAMPRSLAGADEAGL